MEEHVHHAITASSAVAAPSDVAHLLREGSGISGILPTSSSPSNLNLDNFRLDGRAEVFLDTTAHTDRIELSPVHGADELVESDEAQQQ